jgi:chemotaxis protein histidine kinase CheA
MVTNFLGGKLHLDSEPSKGTRIQLVLPRTAQPSKVDAGLANS